MRARAGRPGTEATRLYSYSVGMQDSGGTCRGPVTSFLTPARAQPPARAKIMIIIAHDHGIDIVLYAFANKLYTLDLYICTQKKYFINWNA